MTIEFIKVNINHILCEIFTDEEIGKLYRLQAKTAFYGRNLLPLEKIKILSPDDEKEINKKLNLIYKTTINDILNKVLKNVEKVEIEKIKAKEKIKLWREKTKNIITKEDKPNKTEKKETAKQTRNVFTKPTIEEVENYCNERKNNVDSHKFWNFYESKGWMVGSNKMKSWKSSVVTWEKEEKPQAIKIFNEYRGD